MQESEEQNRYTKEQYKELAKWTERVALALLISVVIAGYFEGSFVTAITGVFLSGGVYRLALSFLKQS